MSSMYCEVKNKTIRQMYLNENRVWKLLSKVRIKICDQRSWRRQKLDGSGKVRGEEEVGGGDRGGKRGGGEERQEGRQGGRRGTHRLLKLLLHSLSELFQQLRVLQGHHLALLANQRAQQLRAFRPLPPGGATDAGRQNGDVDFSGSGINCSLFQCLAMQPISMKIKHLLKS